MGSVPVFKAGIGSAMNDTTRQIGGALGVAVLGTIMNSTYISQIEASELITKVPENLVEPIKSSIQSAHIVAGELMGTNPATAQEITNISSSAFTSGMVDAMIIGGITMAVAAVITLIILPSRIRSPHE
jgi:phosphotransferase system  glucose/maltose/N-acetylglucosamine-specific IIC component